MAGPLPDNGDSSQTGGPLLPRSDSLEDDELEDVISAALAGTTGLPNAMVKPAFAPTNFQRPEPTESWVAFVVQTSDVISSKPAWVHDGAAAEGLGQSTVLPQEVLEVLASFYGPRSQFYAKLARDGLKADQNRWVLRANGLALIEVTNLRSMHQLGEDVNQQTQRRTDALLRFARCTPRDYAVRSLARAQFDVTHRGGAAPAVTEHRETGDASPYGPLVGGPLTVYHVKEAINVVLVDRVPPSVATTPCTAMYNSVVSPVAGTPTSNTWWSEDVDDFLALLRTWLQKSTTADANGLSGLGLDDATAEAVVAAVLANAATWGS